ncbi:MarR family transcriptional regulator [Microbacterium caowuchunii]|jgi:MarR family|uniref:MarR family transcriptional regulator n=1 Tax=Microbacterium caowuchunii TaxID=2614638 RepID=UPI001245B635|nr:MarR family transcriptional regulator [Microbacterium caowuchunii]QEW00905.1 MarR family transcriptional regulator [Microbacterium caowuchunii]
MAEPDPQQRAARAVERLRLSEASLSRRRQTQCGPSENARAAMRFILERADAGERVTPRAVAAHLGVSAAAVSGILDKLHSGGMITFAVNPDDRRSKHVLPFDRSTDADDVDPLTARIREEAADLDPVTAEAVAAFIERVVRSVDAECR